MKTQQEEPLQKVSSPAAFRKLLASKPVDLPCWIAADSVRRELHNSYICAR